MTNAEGATDVWKDIGHQQVNLIRNAIEFLDDGEALTALSIVLVERALNLKRKDGTRGNAFEVKALIGTLTNGMIDIASAQSLTLQRHGPGLHRAAESLRQGEAEIYDLSRPILVSIKDGPLEAQFDALLHQDPGALIWRLLGETARWALDQRFAQGSTHLLKAYATVIILTASLMT